MNLFDKRVLRHVVLGNEVAELQKHERAHAAEDEAEDDASEQEEDEGDEDEAEEGEEEDSEEEEQSEEDEDEEDDDDDDEDDDEEPEWPLPVNGRFSGLDVAPLRTRSHRANTTSSKASNRTLESLSSVDSDD